MADRRRARSYDEVAEAFERGRPGYPEALIEKTIRLAALPAGGRILEIGCGSGQATVPFARRGFRMLCLEPGTGLAAIARRKLAPFPAVEVREAWFEEWPEEREAFDLVLAATSLHHVEEGERYAKPARVLRPGGSLAILQNLPGEDPPGFRAELDALYTRWRGAAESAAFTAETTEVRVAAIRDELAASGLFRAPEVRLVPWTVPYDAARSEDFLDSDSGRIRHPPEALAGLKRGIGEAIARRGGTVQRGFLACLVTARKL